MSAVSSSPGISICPFFPSLSQRLRRSPCNCFAACDHLWTCGSAEQSGAEARKATSARLARRRHFHRKLPILFLFVVSNSGSAQGLQSWPGTSLSRTLQWHEAEMTLTKEDFCKQGLGRGRPPTNRAAYYTSARVRYRSEGWSGDLGSDVGKVHCTGEKISNKALIYVT